MSTKIEWCDETWNPITGCTPVSPGCLNCFAAARFARGLAPGDRELVRITRRRNAKGRLVQRPVFNGRIYLHPDRLDIPLRWKKPRVVFVNSQSDLFHEDVPFPFIAAVFGVMAAAPRHTFVVLTKRDPRPFFKWMRSEAMREDSAAWLWARKYLKESLPARHPSERAWPLPNVILGVSAEDQQRADERVPWLLQSPAACRAVSYEPALGPVDLDLWLVDELHRMGRAQRLEIDWVIAGAESGPGRRPMDERWVRRLRDQCRAAGTAFFYKQAVRAGKVVSLPELDGERHAEWPDIVRR